MGPLGCIVKRSKARNLKLVSKATRHEREVAVKEGSTLQDEDVEFHEEDIKRVWPRSSPLMTASYGSHSDSRTPAAVCCVMSGRYAGPCTGRMQQPACCRNYFDMGWRLPTRWCSVFAGKYA